MIIKNQKSRQLRLNFLNTDINKSTKEAYSSIMNTDREEYAIHKLGDQSALVSPSLSMRNEDVKVTVVKQTLTNVNSDEHLWSQMIKFKQYAPEQELKKIAKARRQL